MGEAGCFEALGQVEGPCVNLALNESEGRRPESGTLRVQNYLALCPLQTTFGGPLPPPWLVPGYCL